MLNQNVENPYTALVLVGNQYSTIITLPNPLSFWLQQVKPHDKIYRPHCEEQKHPLCSVLFSH